MTDSQKLDKLLEAAGQMQGQISSMENRIGSMEDRIGSLENKIEPMEGQFRTIFDRLDVLEYKQDLASKKLDDLRLDVKISERDIRKDIHKINDQMETVILVLRQKKMLPA